VPVPRQLTITVKCGCALVVGLDGVGEGRMMGPKPCRDKSETNQKLFMHTGELIHSLNTLCVYIIIHIFCILRVKVHGRKKNAD
jgi:hypothetical protein